MAGLVQWLRREDGQTMIEYALLAFFVSIAAIAVLTLLGPQVADIFNQVYTALGG